MPSAPRPLPLLMLSAAVTAVAATIGSIAGGRLELRQQVQQLKTDIVLRRELLRSEIERHRLLPTILADNPELAVAVDPSADEARRAKVIARLNDEFDRLARTDGAATLYLVDAGGITRVASNHRLASSFVGQDYSFRSYFRDALRSGFGELFAQGTVSGVPGLYLAQRLATATGVVVTKIEFTSLEQSWRTPNDQTLVTDRTGTALLTSNPKQRFQRQPQTRPDEPGLISTSLPAEYRDWTVLLLRDVRSPLLASRLVGAAIGGLLGLLSSIAFFIAYAGRRRRERQREELERLVAHRTVELESSNQKLRHEIEERARSESKVQKLREDLAQANRLAILGQISAGVAHEINQPTAAIRTYVDNARKLFERGDHANALSTLANVDALTERVGLITEELRGFSRRSLVITEPVRIADVIDGSKLLLEQQLRSRRISLLRPDAPEMHTVTANRMRLEQVVVNLVQNAMDALADTAKPEIRITAGSEESHVWFRIADNGPGVPPERRSDLFAPFSSSKPLGLGLGLVICRDILADLGGSIEFSPTEPHGATFTVRLPA